MKTRMIDFQNYFYKTIKKKRKSKKSRKNRKKK